MKAWLLLVLSVFLLASCGSPTLSWNSRIAVYELHHEFKQRPIGEGYHEIFLSSRGVPDEEMEEALKLLKSIQHYGQ